MYLTFSCLIIIQYLFILRTYADQSPVCEIVPKTRRSDREFKDNVPSYDPYIPRANTVLYNCSKTECVKLQLDSIVQITSPEIHLKSCYEQAAKYQCETIRYNYFKNIDKLLFLNNNVRNKTFYLVDCLVYSDRGRVCHKKDDIDSHTKLVDTGTIVRPNEPNILSQDEFLCEQFEGIVNCDLNSLIPYTNGLKLKKSVKYNGDILLKTGEHVVTLKKNCINTWCGYTGLVLLPKTRRFTKYDSPGGKVYQCYYAKKQQICKPLYVNGRYMYNERD